MARTVQITYNDATASWHGSVDGTVITLDYENLEGILDEAINASMAFFLNQEITVTVDFPDLLGLGGPKRAPLTGTITYDRGADEWTLDIGPGLVVITDEWLDHAVGVAATGHIDTLGHRDITVSFRWPRRNQLGPKQTRRER